MKLHIYTNNAYDTVALIQDDKIVAQWDERAIIDALNCECPDDWDNQGLDMPLDEFEPGNELWAVIDQDGNLHKPDPALFDERQQFHVRD